MYMLALDWPLQQYLDLLSIKSHHHQLCLPQPYADEITEENSVDMIFFLTSYRTLKLLKLVF
uniref:Uncharacterized protein n=1 Tax=Arion vulgaris TaxID=1028688 RepID=A0A0B6ZXL8_9EUPU